MREFIIVLFAITFIYDVCSAQFRKYDTLFIDAKQFIIQLDFPNAASVYSKAFNTQGIKIFPEDRYDAAIAWTLCDSFDSAFFNLFYLAEKTTYLDGHPLFPYTPEFKMLHADNRWNKLLLIVNTRDKVYNDSLAHILLTIKKNDQKYRAQIDSIAAQSGRKSEAYQLLWNAIDYYDSLNLLSVIEIIDRFGWLGANEVGIDGNSALWLVIQHAPLPVQEKYYPIMLSAVETGKASKKHLAYLLDRILIRQGKKQLYGTQSRTDYKTEITKVEDVEDPANLNRRRAWVGLPAMKVY
jgi:hypothetical protein